MTSKRKTVALILLLAIVVAYVPFSGPTLCKVNHHQAHGMACCARAARIACAIDGARFSAPSCECHLHDESAAVYPYAGVAEVSAKKIDSQKATYLVHSDAREGMATGLSLNPATFTSKPIESGTKIYDFISSYLI